MRIVIRAGVLAGIEPGLILFDRLAHPEGGANIGLGMLILVLPLVIPIFWAAFDARRMGPTTLVTVWSATTVLAVAAAVSIRAARLGTGEAFREDLWVLLLVAIAAGAVLGGLLGWAINSGSAPARRDERAR